MNKIIGNILGIIGTVTMIACAVYIGFMIWSVWDYKKKSDAHLTTIPYKIIYRDTCSIKPLIKDSL